MNMVSHLVLQYKSLSALLMEFLVRDLWKLVDFFLWNSDGVKVTLSLLFDESGGESLGYRCFGVVLSELCWVLRSWKL